jgi:NRPS condensation-like uncharacterized protein
MHGLKISEIQRQFWLLQRVYRNNLAYNIPVVLKFNGVPDVSALEYAYNSVIIRHEALRTFFEEINEEVYQRIVSPDQVHLKIEKIEMREPLPDNSLPEEIRNEIHLPFNLGEWPLHRMKIFVFPDGVSVLTIVFNHIITDLESKKIFAEDFSEFYNSYISGWQPHFNNIQGNYSDYTRQSEEWLGTEEASDLKAEWKKFITEVPENPEFPSDFPKPKINNQEGRRKHFTLGSDLYGSLKAFAAGNSVSTFTVLLTVW